MRMLTEQSVETRRAGREQLKAQDQITPPCIIAHPMHLYYALAS
jgi:hypothetical protein